jgi:hypothetical protein
MLMRSEFRILPVTLYELFWNIVVIFCLVFSLVERRRESKTAFCDSAGPALPRASHMTRCRVSGLVTHARALHLVTLLDKRLAGWSVCPTVPQNPVRMTRRMISNRQDDRIHGHPGDRSSISCHSAPADVPPWGEAAALPLVPLDHYP